MTERMKLYKKYFPEDSMIDSEETLDGEYLSGTFDEWLMETGYDPEEIGVSPEAIIRRYRERDKAITTEKADPADYLPNGLIAPQAISTVVTEIMRPLLESIGTLLKNNTEAMEQIASSQDVIRNRMEALEKQVRLQTPVTDKQARYLQDAARGKARELLEKKEKGLGEDRKAVNKLSGMIKKSVMMRYGLGSLREIPRCEYEVAMSQISTWSNAIELFEIVKEARERKEKTDGQE